MIEPLLFGKIFIWFDTGPCYEPRPLETLCLFVGHLKQKTTPRICEPVLKNLYILYTDTVRLAELFVDRVIARSESPALVGFQFLPKGVRPPLSYLNFITTF